MEDLHDSRRPASPARHLAEGDTWKTGGASVWMTGNYDPQLDLIYWGTGNGAPWIGDQRPGDNLYTSSTIALDVRHRQDQGPFPVPLERLLGLGRDESRRC